MQINQTSSSAIENQKYNQNSIHIDKFNKKIYLPGYLRLKLKNFVSMDLKNLDIQLNVAIIFNIKYGQKGNDKMKDIPSNIVEQIKDGLIFLFQKHQGMNVKQVDQDQRKLEVTVKNDKQNKEVKYTVRRKINAKVYPDIFWTPFELIHSIVSITVQPIKLCEKLGQGEDQLKQKLEWTVYINLMNHPNNFLKLSYDTADAFGNYSLAWNRMRSNFTDERVENEQQFFQKNKMQLLIQKFIPKCLLRPSKQVNKKQLNEQYVNKIKNKLFRSDIQETFVQRNEKQKKKSEQRKRKQENKAKQGSNNQKQINKFKENNKNRSIISQNNQKKSKIKQNTQIQFKQFKFANFLIPIYKYPSVQILTIFLPLVLLSIINLGIFFQNWDLYDRIASISILLIAFVALIPTLRDDLPPTTKVVFIQYLVYFQTYTSVLALAHSMSIMSRQQQLLNQAQNDINQQLAAGLTPNPQKASDRIDGYDLALSNELFLLSLIVTCVVNFIIIVLLAIHKWRWEPDYNVKPLLIQEKQKFVASNWSNSVCRQKLKQSKFEDRSYQQFQKQYAKDQQIAKGALKIIKEKKMSQKKRNEMKLKQKK